jgi:hypothetical protein
MSKIEEHKCPHHRADAAIDSVIEGAKTVAGAVVVVPVLAFGMLLPLVPLIVSVALGIWLYNFF